ncbi:MAG: right-handed parallel beta-helix repeat-containing protein [Armatimonadetes bacterium]|nr:right-handed parallel beta-helix repeat-containing protein [Armatimonadota bacterium]
MRLPLLVLTLAAMAQAAVNEQAIAEVAAGKLKVAKASWWGFDPADSTKALQAAINSNVPKLVVDNVGQPWVVTPLRLVSNQEIEFEKGVEVVAKKGEFKGTNDSLLSADLKENIILRGYGATLRMQRADYDGPDYKHAEWRHCLSLKSCSNVRVEGLTLAESGGDGIYLGTAKQWVTNLNVTIKDVVLDKNYRQGISVITAENLLIENTIMRDTAGTAPMAGIDFEPNHPQERLLNVVMRNCVTENNKGGGFVYYVPNLDASSEQR